MRTKHKKAVMSVRLKSSVSRRLGSLAEATDRTRSYLAAKAIEQYIELQEWQIDGIKKALASLDAGHFASQAKVRAAFKRAQAH